MSRFLSPCMTASPVVQGLFFGVMIMSLYSGLSKPQGRYASRLELAWAIEFAHWGWDANYIGDQCDFADFEVSGVKIEVKPDGEKYVQQAASRSGNILIVEGSPRFARWWFVDYVHTALPMEISPQLIPNPAIYGSQIRMETIQEFIDRKGWYFE